MHPLAEMSLSLMEDLLADIKAAAPLAVTPLEIHLNKTYQEACEFGISLHHEYLVRNENYPV